MYLLNRRSVSKAKPYLLLHCNGADGSTTFTDSGPEGHSFSAINNAQIDTAQSKFGGASVLFDGADDGIETADGDFNLSTNFTFDFFVRFSDLTTMGGASMMFGIFYESGVADYWGLSYDHDGTALNFNVYSSSSPVVQVSGTDTLSIDTWYHIALCKVGNEYGIYRDGDQKAHDSDSSTASIALDGALNFGVNAPGVGSELYGWLDEIRIVKSNPFNANPVSGLTDKIQVPQQPYPSWS